VVGNLRRGEAVIYTPVAGEPTRCAILPIELADVAPLRIDPAGPQHSCEIAVHPEECLPDFRSVSSHATLDEAAPSTELQKPNDGFETEGF
jgi:hypothetical protein